MIYQKKQYTVYMIYQKKEKNDEITKVKKLKVSKKIKVAVFQPYTAVYTSIHEGWGAILPDIQFTPSLYICDARASIEHA